MVERDNTMAVFGGDDIETRTTPHLATKDSVTNKHPLLPMIGCRGSSRWEGVGVGRANLPAVGGETQPVYVRRSVVDATTRRRLVSQMRERLGAAMVRV